MLPMKNLVSMDALFIEQPKQLEYTCTIGMDNLCAGVNS